MTPRRAALAFAVVPLAIGACAPDPPDAYSVAAPPATRAPIPTTSAPPPTTVPPPPTTAEAGDTLPPPTAPPPTTEPPPPPTFPANGETVEVRALDNTFRAQTIEIVAGTEVRWINGGRNEHNVLPTDEVADVADFEVERDVFLPGTEYTYVFTEPGVYPYYCDIHGTQDVGMIGTVVVTAP